MEHADVLELIELAALEPDGLARLAAGDTPEAAAVAGHLAGCETCAAELARTARAAAVVRDAIRELPDPGLRARTLGFIAENGVDRSRPTAVAPENQPSSVRSRPARRPGAWWALVGVAAVLIAAVAGFAAGGAVRAPRTDEDVATVMASVRTTMHIAQQPDAVHIELASTRGGATVGTALYSPSTGELSMTASGLEPIPDDAVYACWLEADGQRRQIGVLYLEGGEGTWAGPVAGLASLGPHPVFTVSLVLPGSGGGSEVLRGSG